MLRAGFFFLGFGVLSLLAGCGDGDGGSSTAEGAAADSNLTSTFRTVVWHASADGKSYVSEVIRGGVSVATDPSLRIAVSDGVVVMNEVRSTLALHCHLDLGGGHTVDRDGVSDVEQVGFVNDRTNQGQTALMLPDVPKPNELIDRKWEVAVTGSVGPYVFLRKTADTFGCGAAHPQHGVRAYVWDVERRAEAGFQITAPPEALEKARTALAKDGFGEGMPNDVALAEVIPTYDAKGDLSLDYRFEKPVSFGQSDFVGSGYTVSTLVKGSELAQPAVPAALAKYKSPPEQIAAFLGANPKLQLRGWSQGF
jgi:hypothetical protein